MADERQTQATENKVSAYCDCCDNSDYGTKEALENKGWELNSNSQFCSEHNY